VFSCDYNGWADVPEEEREGIEVFEDGNRGCLWHHQGRPVEKTAKLILRHAYLLALLGPENTSEAFQLACLQVPSEPPTNHHHRRGSHTFGAPHVSTG
jgi:hypothetical protein